MKSLVTQLAMANKKNKSPFDLIYAYSHATLDGDLIKLPRFSCGDNLFGFIRRFYGLKGLPNLFTLQVSPFFKDMIRQGSALVYIDDVVLMSNSKSQTTYGATYQTIS